MKKKTVRKRTTKKASSKAKKPIGFTKVGKTYAFVFGSKKKPRLSSIRYSTKKTLASAYAKKYA